MILGRDANGAYWGYFIPTTATCENGLGNAASVGSCANWQAYRPINFSGAAAGYGSFAIPNVRGFREYLSRNFYSPEWSAEDDPTYAGVPALSTAESEFTFPAPGIPGGFQDSSYCFSPAAMLDPSVLRPRAEGGFRAPASFAHSYRAPAVANGQGYRSPSNAQCPYPSLKTRLLERHCMEPNLGMNPYVPGGETPHQWNHSYFARSYAAFFDGSVRLFTTAEAMGAQDRATRFPLGGQHLWISSSPFGHEFFGNIAEDYLVKTGAHDLTTNGIHGRDTLPPP